MSRDLYVNNIKIIVLWLKLCSHLSVNAWIPLFSFVGHESCNARRFSWPFQNKNTSMYHNHLVCSCNVAVYNKNINEIFLESTYLSEAKLNKSNLLTDLKLRENVMTNQWKMFNFYIKCLIVSGRNRQNNRAYRIRSFNWSDWRQGQVYLHLHGGVWSCC